MGKNVNDDITTDLYAPNSRINLRPTPGKAPLIGRKSTEVLQSDPESGAYVAFTSQVPPTQYFDILGRADCDDWVYLQLMNTEMLLNRPQYYGGGEYTGDKPLFKCAGIAHKRYRASSDPRLYGSDGVIFDAESAIVLNNNGWFNQNIKIHMDGWAIKFVEPSANSIASRLAKKPESPIDVLQMRAAAFWIKNNNAKQFTGDLRRLLPSTDSKGSLWSWRPEGLAILDALASIEDANTSDAIYRSLLESGVAEMLRPGSLHTIAVSKSSATAYVAANVILCRNQPGAKQFLRSVLLNATVTQHKLASAQALLDLGDSAFLQEQLNQGALGDLYAHVVKMIDSPKTSPFTCPYRSTYHA